MFLWLGAQQPGAKVLWKPLTALTALSPPSLKESGIVNLIEPAHLQEMWTLASESERGEDEG